METVKDYGGLLCFGAAVPFAEVRFEGVPLVGGAITVKEFVDFRIRINGEFRLDKGEFVLWIDDARAAVRIVDAL
ncbi:MAG: hypothetical protein VX904_09400 [Planctomycetota bacterium]|nr:hypothetical protein [Planctomycetota bacterium]